MLSVIKSIKLAIVENKGVDVDVSNRVLHGVKEGGVIQDHQVPDMSEQDEQSFIERMVDRMGDWKDKLRLGPHHKMERFATMVGSTVFFLLLFALMAFVTYRTDVAEYRASQAVFTKDFAFSLSGQRGTIQGVYGNEDKTDVMVLFQFSNPGDMSANAENYELFITGEKRSMRYEPKVTFALFGTTGYGIVRFTHDEPLRSEILNITIRAHETLSQSDSTPRLPEDADGTFEKYDQARFFVNLGADAVETLDGFEHGENDPRLLYTLLVANAKDIEIREKIDEHTEQLRTLLARENEYVNRLTSSGYVAPDRPWFIAGDYVDDDGVFRPATLLSNAHDFDYWTHTIRDGYLHQVVSDVSEFGVYMESKTTRTSDLEARKDTERQEQVDRVDMLITADGSEIPLASIVTGRSASAEVSAKDAIETLLGIWRSYLTEKGRLQRETLRELLLLDADIQSQPKSYSEHSGDSAYTFY